GKRVRPREPLPGGSAEEERRAGDPSGSKAHRIGRAFTKRAVEIEADVVVARVASAGRDDAIVRVCRARADRDSPRALVGPEGAPCRILESERLSDHELSRLVRDAQVVDPALARIEEDELKRRRAH